MKLQKDTRARKAKPSEPMIRARCDQELKDRINRYAESIDRDEAWVLRKVVSDFLDRQAQPTKVA